MRGLKPVWGRIGRSESFVASFTDAWIETNFSFFCKYSGGVASFTDAWIETEARLVQN